MPTAHPDLRRVERWLGPTLLVASAVLSVVVPDTLHTSAGGLAALTVVAVAWSAAGTTPWVAGLFADEAPPTRGRFWLVGLVALLLVLCELAPLFGFAAWTAYVSVPRVLPATRLWVGALLVALPLAVSQRGGLLPPHPAGGASWVALVVDNSLVATLAVRLWLPGERQQRELEATVEELRRTHQRLEALQEQLVQGAREAGIADERARMAREIHDTLAQGLSGILRQLEAAGSAPADNARRHVDTAARLAAESLTEARRSVQALRPEALDDVALPDALENVAASWATVHDVPAPLTVEGERRSLPVDVDVVLLRCAQEALANVARHAHASRVGVTLTYMGPTVVLDVRDDGVGFDPNAVSRPERRTDEGGYGLSAMRERLAAIHGHLDVESAPGDGTAVSATVPVGAPS